MTQRGDTTTSPSALDADGGKAYAMPMSDSARSVVIEQPARNKGGRPRLPRDAFGRKIRPQKPGAAQSAALVALPTSRGETSETPQKPVEPPPADVIARAFWMLTQVMDRALVAGEDSRWADVQRRAALDIVKLAGGDLRYLGDTELVGQRDRYNAEIARRNVERGG